MRERKGEYFLKIVNEERYQQLFDHPEELRKIITYATIPHKSHTGDTGNISPQSEFSSGLYSQ